MQQVSLKRQSKGFGLVEVLIGASILAMVILGTVSLYFFYLRIGLGNPLRIKATLLAEEGLESVKFIRDGSWTNITDLTPGTTYYLHFDGTSWTANTTPTYPDPSFKRTFIVESVNRNANGDIVPSGGTVDDGTRKITVTIDWRTSQGTTTKNLSTYITNLFDD